MESQLRSFSCARCLLLMLLACSGVLALGHNAAGGATDGATVVGASWTSAPSAASSPLATNLADVLPLDNSNSLQVQTATPLQRTRSKAVRMAAAQLKAAKATAIVPSLAATAAADDDANTNDAETMAMNTMYQTIFEKHNTYRARHQAAALTWSDTLAAQAAAYAARCNFAHDAYANAGENLFAISDTSNPVGALTQAIDLWYDEVQMYNFNRPVFSAATGHFTQVVWRSSSALGCAVQACTNGLGSTSFQRASFVVCRYSPAGNVIGAFPQNVLPVSNTPAPPPTVPQPPASRPPASPLPAIPPPTPPATTPPTPPATPPATPPHTQPLVPPATLPSGYLYASPGCLYSLSQEARLCMEESGYVVLYAGGVPGQAVWVSPNMLTSSFRPYKLVMGLDGNLQVTDNLNRQLWQSGTTGRGNAPYRMVVEDVGAAVIYDAAHVQLWSTAD